MKGKRVIEKRDLDDGLPLGMSIGPGPDEEPNSLPHWGWGREIFSRIGAGTEKKFPIGGSGPGNILPSPPRPGPEILNI